MRSMLSRNQNEMNRNWEHKTQQRENIRIMGMDSKLQVSNLLFYLLIYIQSEEIKEKERQENELRRLNQMNYRYILDGQVKSKINSPIPIPLEPHLDNKILIKTDDKSKN